MASRWLLTVRADCDLEALTRALADQGVELDVSRKPMPLDSGEQVLTVTVKGKLPDHVRRMRDVVRINPASKMDLF